eukprot:CAMPEP_0198289304 /NCGR_PEP_ID=MMETSP1449-20131203/7534_1 /TAXON_ID=420275 /ORGANISM="Attheya septentrionalis, Strain CCMP2084" /LENGTH=483 /DNA_ID=CAMNT_0043987611 /DNA_START=157 /DNA_END=1605 /DNA_ORIENTATION=+
MNVSTEIRCSDSEEDAYEDESNGPFPLNRLDSECRDERGIPHKTTEMQTFFHLLKGYIGPGCLSLPWAFSQLGITVGFLSTIGLSFLTSYNCLSVVRVFREQIGEGQATNDRTRDSSRKEITYADVGAMAYGVKFRIFVTFSILTQQLAICTIFFSFIGENLISILHKLSGHDGLLDKKIVAITLSLPTVLALSCIPDLRALAPVSKVGLVMLLASFVMLGTAVAENWGEHVSPQVELSKVPIAMCAIMYSFEGVCLVMPVEQSMKHPKKFNRTFILAMVTTCIVYSSVGVTCVMAFGSISNGSITAFLMNNSDQYVGVDWVILSNALVTLSVLFTYPLQLFPCIGLVAKIVQTRSLSDDSGGVNTDFIPLDTDEMANERDEEPTTEDLQDLDGPMLRAGLVIFTYIVAITIPNVQELISFAGAFAGSATALIIPPLIDLKFVLQSNRKTSLAAIKCYLLLIIGLVFGIIGTSASIVDIYKVW